ncbi:MAG: hypothetical protein QOD77_676 [Thermoplasmata archaeon]|jgi:hypothetical protein|nr:hypothetical protein [Thermoplasmata archaeon]
MTATDAFLKNAGVPFDAATAMVNAWPIAPDAGGELNAAAKRVSSLAQLAVGEDSDWPTKQNILERSRLGIYSPVQLVLLEAANATPASTDLEYPFAFSSVGLATELLVKTLQREPNPTGTTGWPPTDSTSYDKTRRLLQSMFQQREVREEGEPPSMEIIIPMAEDDAALPQVTSKKLGQVFGRGVAMLQGSGLATLPASGGQVFEIFQTHDTAPGTNLYTLEESFSHLPERKMSLTLRRDGHVTIAMDKNPILEFYNGGWHICDLKYSRIALQAIAQAAFGTAVRPEILPRILTLAYHMATHGHGGIIGVVPEAVAAGADSTIVEFEPQSPESIGVTNAIRAVKDKMKLTGDLTIDRLAQIGFGRLLLAANLQDGATLFLPDGHFHSSGRMVKRIAAGAGGGSGARAAKGIGAAGLAIKISEDGAIKVYSSMGGDKTPDDGLRIH